MSAKIVTFCSSESHTHTHYIINLAERFFYVKHNLVSLQPWDLTATETSHVWTLLAASISMAWLKLCVTGAVIKIKLSGAKILYLNMKRTLGPFFFLCGNFSRELQLVSVPNKSKILFFIIPVLQIYDDL